MTNLMNANLYRLKKSKCFWILLIIMFLLGIYFYINYNGFHPERCVNCTNELGSVLFLFLESTWMILPIFTTTFLAPVHQNGIIKNMIVIGHKRSHIYLVNLITNIFVSILFSLAFVLGAVLMGIIMVSEITIPMETLSFYIIDSIFLSISYASLYTFVGMLFDKISSISISFIVVIWGMIVCSNLIMKLQYMSDISHSSHLLYEMILSSIPVGQSFLINNFVGNAKVLWLYSLVFIGMINYLGILYMNKKEWKSF